MLPAMRLCEAAGKVCKRGVVTVGEFDELTAAARLMRDKHIGYLVVVESNPRDGTLKPVGVITDRDIVVAGEILDVAGSIRNEQLVENAQRP